MGAVCDPIEQIEPYLRVAQETGMKIHYVIDTHVHADHVSGGRRLAEATGADYVLRASAGAQFPFHGVAENEQLELGNVQIRVLHTPGHKPEHIALIVTDKARGPEPWFLLSGHTLMVGGQNLPRAPRRAPAPCFAACRSSKLFPIIWKCCREHFPVRCVGVP